MNDQDDRLPDLRHQLQAYNNAISKLEGDLDQLKGARRSLEMRIHQIEATIVPITMLKPRGGPRRPAVIATCHRCSRKTTLTAIRSGLPIAECVECQREAFATDLLGGIFTNHSAPEQNLGG